MMSAWVGPVVLALMSILMTFGINFLQDIIDQAELMEVNDLRNRPSSLNTKIYDNFLESDNELLTKLQDRSEWVECDKLRPRWWDGKSEPKNIWEELAKKIWLSRPEFKKAVGFEYWCNIVFEGTQLPWHIDKDEDAMADLDILITPLLGAVYYGFNHDGQYTGGKLWTIDAQYGEDFSKFLSIRKRELIEINANFNRLIYFNASLWHKVSEVKSGKRYTFAVNALDQIPMRLLDK